MNIVEYIDSEASNQIVLFSLIIWSLIVRDMQTFSHGESQMFFSSD